MVSVIFNSLIVLFYFRLVRRLFSSSRDLECNSAQDVADYIKAGKVKKVVVMAGAGISTLSGIPDFR